MTFESVIDVDNAQDMAVLVANGMADEVVLGHLVGHELLIEVRGNPTSVAIRQVLETIGVLGPPRPPTLSSTPVHRALDIGGV